MVKDLLPEHIPEARVQTFGYDPGVTAGGVVSMTSIMVKAQDLLYALHREKDFNKVCSLDMGLERGLQSEKRTAEVISGKGPPHSIHSS